MLCLTLLLKGAHGVVAQAYNTGKVEPGSRPACARSLSGEPGRAYLKNKETRRGRKPVIVKVER